MELSIEWAFGILSTIIAAAGLYYARRQYLAQKGEPTTTPAPEAKAVVDLNGLPNGRRIIMAVPLVKNSVSEVPIALNLRAIHDHLEDVVVQVRIPSELNYGNEVSIVDEHGAWARLMGIKFFVDAEENFSNILIRIPRLSKYHKTSIIIPISLISKTSASMPIRATTIDQVPVTVRVGLIFQYVVEILVTHNKGIVKADYTIEVVDCRAKKTRAIFEARTRRAIKLGEGISVPDLNRLTSLALENGELSDPAIEEFAIVRFNSVSRSRDKIWPLYRYKKSEGDALTGYFHKGSTTYWIPGLRTSFFGHKISYQRGEAPDSIGVRFPIRRTH